MENKPNITAPVPNVLENNRNTKQTLIASLSFFVGIPIILFVIVFMLFVIPTLSKLYDSLDIDRPIGITLFYPISAVVIIVGLINVLLGVKTLRNAKYLKVATYIAVGTFLIQALLAIFIVAAIIAPMYNIVNQIQNAPNKTTETAPNSDSNSQIKLNTFTNTTEGFSFEYPADWEVEDGSDITNGVSPQLSKKLPESDKPALISFLKFNSSEFTEENLRDFAPFAHKDFEKDGNTFIIIAYTYQIGAGADEPTKQIALETLSTIASSFKFVGQGNNFCGGIAGIACPNGFTCHLDGDYPDAGGICIKD